MVVTKICPKCRKKYPDVSLGFCLEDGTKLIEDKTGNDLPPTISFSPKPAEILSSDSEKEADSKTSSLLMLGAGAILFALVAGVLGFVFLRDKSSLRGNQSPTSNIIQDYNKPVDSANRQTAADFKDNSKDCALSDAEKLAVKDINFSPASFKITPETEKILKDLSARFKQLPENCFVEIGVHTDDVGSQTINTQLSTERARAIEKYLIDSGISSDKLSFFGYGSSQPIAPNSSDENRRLNRRVEIRLFTKDKSSDAGGNSAADVFDLKDQGNLNKLKAEGLNIVTANPFVSGKPNPLTLIVGISANGDSNLNSEKTGNVLGKNNLSEKLKEVFKMREEMQIYREGTSAVEKTVTIKVPSQIERKIFDETLKTVRDAGASPINIFVEN